MKNILTSLFIFIGYSFASGEASASSIFELPIPDENHAAITVERGLSGVVVSDALTIAFPGKLQHMVRIPLDLGAKTREKKFGSMTEQLRIPLQDAKYPGDWRGAIFANDRIIAWDASMLQLLVMRKSDFKTVLSSTVPTDVIRPAADRLGEPTSKETQKTRLAFKSASKKIFGSKYTGLAEVPSSWIRTQKKQFFVSTRIPGFPVVTMSCQSEEQDVCVIDRQCFLEGKKNIASTSITGIGVSQTNRNILIGDLENNEIQVYRFNSCFDVVWQRTLKLPSRLPKISNITVDASDRLWITTNIPDSFTDSNLFFWDSQQWNAK